MSESSGLENSQSEQTRLGGFGGARFLALCTAICASYLVFALTVAVHKAGGEYIDRPVLLALVLGLPIWFLTTSSVQTLCRFGKTSPLVEASRYDLCFYAFLPLAAAGICAIPAIDELCLVQVFLLVGGLKGLACMYWLARASDSGSGCWPTVLIGTILILATAIVLSATAGYSKRIKQEINLRPDTYLDRSKPRLQIDIPRPVVASSVRLTSYLLQSGAVLEAKRVGLLRVTSQEGKRFDFPLLAGVHTAEKCYELPNTRAHIRHRRALVCKTAVEFLTHGEPYLGRAYCATFSFGQRIIPRKVELFFSLDMPRFKLLRLYCPKLEFIDDG